MKEENKNNKVEKKDNSDKGIKKFKDKSANFIKTAKGKIVFGVSLTSVILGGVFLYNHYENTKPIGTEDTVVTSKEKDVDKRGRDLRAKEVLATQVDGSKSNDRGFKYLFESPIAVAIESINQKNKK